MASKNLSDLFDTFEREAFRLETLDDYSGSGNTEAYRAFLSGQPRPADYNEAWIAELRSHTALGKRIYRVHVLTRPLTPYLRFELGWGYQANAAGGEEFYILDVTGTPNPFDEQPDFWLFDETTAVLMHYDETGRIIRRETLPSSCGRDFVGLRDRALEQAQPFPDWWAKYGE